MKRTHGPAWNWGVAKTLALATILLTACDKSRVVGPDEKMSIDERINQISLLLEPAPASIACARTGTWAEQHGDGARVRNSSAS